MIPITMFGRPGRSAGDIPKIRFLDNPCFGLIAVAYF